MPLNRVLKSTAIWSIADQVLLSGANLLIGVAAARLIGISEFGKFTVVLIVAAFVQALQASLVSVPMMTVAGRRTRSAAYFNAILLAGIALSLVAGLITVLTLAGLAGLRGDISSLAFLLAAFLYAVVQNCQTLVRRMLFVQASARQALLMDLLRLALIVAIVALLRLTDDLHSADSLLWDLTVASTLSMLPFLVTRLRARFDMRLLREVVGRHWRYARWLLPVVVLTFLQDQVVWLFMSVMLSDAAVGGLRAGQVLIGVAHLLMMAMENFVPSRAAEAYRSLGSSGLRSYLLQVSVAMGVPTLALILLVALPAERWLSLVFGSAFAEYGGILRIYALSYVIIFVRDILVHYFRATEMTAPIFKSYVVGAAVSLLLAYPLLEMWGALGAALLLLATHTVSLIYLTTTLMRSEKLAKPRAQPA